MVTSIVYLQACYVNSTVYNMKLPETLECALVGDKNMSHAVVHIVFGGTG